MLDGSARGRDGCARAVIEIGNLSEIDVWIPLTLAADAPREDRTLRLSGRLKPGVTLAQATAEVLRSRSAGARTSARRTKDGAPAWRRRAKP